MKNRLSRKNFIGYSAGIITGITYGLNPLFAIPLINNGAAVESILFFRYGLAIIILGAFLFITGQSFHISFRQVPVLLLMGLLYTASSALLFEAYEYIASGLATTLVFLYPALVAIIMVFFKVIPSLIVWIAIAATFVGVVIMTGGESGDSINPIGVILSLGSGLAYAFFIVMINRNKTVKNVSNTLLTFYTLLIGAIVFASKIIITGNPVFSGISGAAAWANLFGLALLPTIVSTSTLAVATRNIGATRASVLGVFEPVTAILVGTIMFGEPLTWNIITGIIISMIAVTFVISDSRQ